MSTTETLDLRGEPCGMPIVRAEKFLLARARGEPFGVLADSEDTTEQLRLLAAKHGWTCEVEREGRDFRALLQRAE